jgi:hypothetical protein
MAECHHDHEECVSHEDGGVLYSLYTKIDLPKVECFNESVEGAGCTVFKPWEQRFDRSKYVESDADEELLFYIPFKNRPPLGFDEVRGKADQTLQLIEDSDGSVEYKLKTICFSGVQTLLLHFPKNFGAETSIIYYIGMRGEFSKSHRHGVTICTYEAKPNPSDHKTQQQHSSTSFVQ